MWLAIDPLIAVGVVLATAATDAVYVMFTSAVVARRRMQAASWSSFWYLLSSFAVIHYTENWAYVAFAAAGSWIGHSLRSALCIGRLVVPLSAQRPTETGLPYQRTPRVR